MDFRSQIPGFREAVSQEQLVRDSAFLNLTESIGEFTVVPLSLRQLLILRMMRSPFVCGKAPTTAQEVIAFLWLLHPAYNPNGGPDLRKLAKRCAKYALPKKPWLHTRRAMAKWDDRCEQVLLALLDISTKIKAYLDEQLMDWPSGTESELTSFFSDATAVCAVLAREHHRSQEWTMVQPLKVILQYLKEVRHKYGHPICNRSDKLVNEYLRHKQDPDSLVGKMLSAAKPQK